MAVLTANGITFSNATVTETNLIPTGTIITTAFVPAGGTPSLLQGQGNEGFLYCSGQAVSRTTFADLFGVISTAFGAGDGSTTFNVPDFRGEFIRGWDDGRLIDSGRGFRTFQDWLGANHSHGGNTGNVSVDHSHGGNTGDRNADHSHGYQRTRNGNRPLDSATGTCNQGDFGFGTSGFNANHFHGFGTGGSSSDHTHNVSTEGSVFVPRNIALAAWIKT